MQMEMNKTPVYDIDIFHPQSDVCKLNANTFEEYLKVVKEDGLLLQMVPKMMKTELLCLEAVKQNGKTLRYVPKQTLTEQICLEALHQDGTQICFIPKEILTYQICLQAVKSYGKSLRVVPEEFLSEELCLQAVRQDGLALQYVPSAFQTKEICVAAVKKNGTALIFVPMEQRKKRICMAALKSSALALAYVPETYKTPDVIKEAITSDVRAFYCAPSQMYTLKNCIEIFQRLLDDKKVVLMNTSVFELDYTLLIAGRLPVRVEKNKRIINLLRKLDLRQVKEKYFDKEEGRFVIREYLKYRHEEIISRYVLFQEFYLALEGDLSGANLSGYDFEGIDLRNYNIDDACVDSSSLIAQSLYDDSFYQEYIKNINYDIDQLISDESEMVEAASILHEVDLFANEDRDYKSQRFYYISDLHLYIKIVHKFQEHATRQEVLFYIQSLIKKMVGTVTSGIHNYKDYLLIAGDVSCSINLVRLFFEELVNHWDAKRIVVVLGNHELWNVGTVFPVDMKQNLDFIITEYRSLFSSLGIRFLHNDLLLTDGQKTVILSEQQLSNMEPHDLRHLGLRCSIIILGGLGFTGLAETFNASMGLYRTTVSTPMDIAESKRFEDLHDMIHAALGKNPVIILTHTPKDNWTYKEYNPDWIYVNGHTHKNGFSEEPRKRVYHDNQIGYKSTSFGLKHFRMKLEYDIFRYHVDGIYIISREEFLEFNRAKGIDVTQNRTDGQIYMLKRNGLYCFLFKKTKNRKLYMMNGGAIKSIENQNLQYYYDNMEHYSHGIKLLYQNYRKALETISEIIIKIGGVGSIHGSIIDVDFLNHIYVNPNDGKVTPYYATTKIDKYVYPDIKALLLERRKDLYDAYIELEADRATVGLMVPDVNTGVDTAAIYVPETDIYRASGIIRSLQYLWNCNVIRRWEDAVINLGITLFPKRY